MNIAIAINSEKKGFLCSLGKSLESNYGFNITYIARDKNVEKIIQDNLGNDKHIIRLDKRKKAIEIDNSDIVREAKLYEHRYNVLFSSLLSMDRGLGQGYFYNVKNVPHVRKSRWPYNKKIRDLVVRFRVYEDIIKNFDVVILTNIGPIINSICHKQKCYAFTLSQTRFGDRYMWSNDCYMTNKKIRDDIDRLVCQKYDSYSQAAYQVDGGGKLNLSRAKVSLIKVFIRIYSLFINDIKKIILGNLVKDSYLPFAWIPNVFISWRNYKYLEKISIYPQDTGTSNVVYMTLHIEPEMSLFQYSPEFSNVYEAIVWLSKSLPVDSILVVKEHPVSLAVRSMHFYKFLSKIPNVKFAHIDSLSYDWIQKSILVSTITGSVGTEAIYQNKPVVSFGRHQLINHLPSVEYVSNYEETKIAVKKFLETKSEILFNISKSCLHEAIISSSIELPDFKKCNKSNKLEPDMANIACENLVVTYASIFK